MINRILRRGRIAAPFGPPWRDSRARSMVPASLPPYKGGNRVAKPRSNISPTLCGGPTLRRRPYLYGI